MPSLTTENGYHHGDLRKALLKAGGQLLVKRGVAALSLREVAKLAGVSHAAPYRHFKCKAALLQALAASGFERLGTAIRMAAVHIPHDPEQQLVAAGLAYVHTAARNPELLQLMFCSGFEQSNEIDLQQASETALVPLIDIINTGIKTGVFRDRDPRELALVAWTSMHGLAMLSVARQMDINVNDERLLDNLARSVLQNVIYGISR